MANNDSKYFLKNKIKIHFKYFIQGSLFRRAVLMSGSASAPWATVDDPAHYAVRLAANLNCSVPR